MAQHNTPPHFLSLFPSFSRLVQLQEKFRLDIDDEGADQVFLKLVDESVAALFPAFFEVLHKVRMAFRN